MFRNEQTYQLLITQHRLEIVRGSRRPSLVNKLVFHGINGTLDQNVDHVASASSTQMPVFRTRSGELLPVSKELQWVLARLTAAVSCVGCKHCHLLHLLEAEQMVVVESIPVVSL
jgi:ornithine cyclodeaminase/alanine dehydrogenase-like protein (mu-crystallin family)